MEAKTNDNSEATSSRKPDQDAVNEAKKERATPRKINIEPENDGLEDYFPFPGVYSQVPC